MAMCVFSLWFCHKSEPEVLLTVIELEMEHGKDSRNMKLSGEVGENDITSMSTKIIRFI